MTLSRTTIAALLGALILLLAACSGAASGGEISVSDARVPVPAATTGAAYMTLSNDGDAADQLVGASTDIASSVELHESSVKDGSMSMQQLDSIDVPAGGEAVLEPGGLHLMLVGVTEDLTEGDTVDLTLDFAESGEQTISAEVVPLGDADPMEAGSEMEMGSEPSGAEPTEMGSEMDMEG